MDNLILITGSSGGGKSTLLAALAELGHEVVEEPGRRVVEAELATGGTAMPWVDPRSFLERVIDLALADYEAHRASSRPVFFDRGLVDALVALEYVTGRRAIAHPAARLRYANTVFVVPPWPEIFATDDARRHGLEEAEAEYRRLVRSLPALGYRPILLPKAPVNDRVAFLLSALSAGA